MKKKLNMMPFVLEQALAGEPVVTRGGRKVNQITLFDVLNPYRVVGVVDGLIMSFQLDGQSSDSKHFDLFMEPKTHIVNGFEVPKPATEQPKKESLYYLPNVVATIWFSTSVWDGYNTDLVRLKQRNIVFLNKEDAIANAKAMAGIDPYGEVNE